MFLIAVIPAWMYALLILLSAWFLISRWQRMPKPHNKTLSTLYYCVLAQVLSSFVPLLLTLQYSISTAACMTGIWGKDFSIALILASLICFFYLCVTSNQGFWAEAKLQKHFIWAVVLAQMLVSMIYLRSALLCTV